MRDKTGVLLAAGGARWEASALAALAAQGMAVVKRCVDLPDLLATATVGQADIAVVSGELPGLDGDAVRHLLRHDVRSVAVGGRSMDLARLGVVATLATERVDELGATVAAARTRPVVADPDPDAAEAAASAGPRGRVVTVHGPAGGPGRTTVAIALAATRAREVEGDGGRVVLVDADPYGGAVAQHLGILDEVSGLLAAARHANAGALDPTAFAECRRRVLPGLEVLTGLPRADRWPEVRAGALDAVIEQAARVGEVVIDCGFSLEDDSAPAGQIGLRPGRNQLTLDAISAADEVVVVGSAEPTGLARLARSLVELGELTPAPLRVVVNRMRDSLGWRERDVAEMVHSYLSPASISFLPEDRAAVDRALVAGRALTEQGDSALSRAVVPLAATVFGRERQAQAEKSR